DLVLRLRVDRDARGRGRLLLVDLPATRHAFVLGKSLRVLGERVLAEHADERRRHALACAGDGLVEALAAGPGVVLVRTHRLARAREALDEPGLVLDVAADDDDLRRCAHGRFDSSGILKCRHSVASRNPFYSLMPSTKTKMDARVRGHDAS